MNRRDFLRLSGVAVAGAALAACGVKTPAPARSSSKGPVQLVYQDWRTEWFPGLAKEMLAEFHDQNPNIRVFYTPDPDDLETKMLSDMESGTAPDVFDGCCNFFPAWAQKGYVLDLRPYVSADLDKETINDWSPAQYNALFTPDGKQFGLPKYHGGLAVYYNKDLFDASQVEYPSGNWSYDNYLAMMKKLTLTRSDGSKQWGSMFDTAWERIQIHANSFGGHFVDPNDDTHCQMGEQPALDGMEWLRKRMWEDKVMASFLDVENVETRVAFTNQKIAMVEDGSWALKDILAAAKFRVGVAPFPKGPVRHTTLATTDGFGIYAGTKHPDAAWELLKFLIGKDFGRAMARVQFLQPSRASLIDDWVGYIRKEYPEQTREMDIAAFADGQTKGYSVTAEIFQNMDGVDQIARDTWDKIYTLGQAPVTEMVNVCKQIETIQKGNSSVPVDCGCKTGA